MTVPVLEERVLLVVGSVPDRFLGRGQCRILADDGGAKIIRMSRPDFIAKFLEVVKALGVKKLNGADKYLERKRQPIPIEFAGIVAAKGVIGAIMMDRKTWNQLRNRNVSLGNIPLRAVSKNGREVEQVKLIEEAIAA